MRKRLFLVILVNVVLLDLFTGCPSPVNSTSGSKTPSSSKEITSFGIENISSPGKIEGSNITLFVPAGTDLSSRLATFATTGIGVYVFGIEQTSGKSKVNLTTPVVYTVKAEDGTTTDYTVYVIENNAKKISSFKFNASENNGIDSTVEGEIDNTNKTITVTVPASADITNLIPKIIISGKSVSPSSGTAKDFSNPVTYTVTAEDGSSDDYTVTVTKAKKSDKEITSFIFKTSENNELLSDVVCSISGTDITVNLPYVSKPLVPSIVYSGASITPETDKNQDFSAPVEYTVTAGDGSSVKYTVTVTIESLTRERLIEMIKNGMDVTQVDTSHITDMNELFKDNKSFNQDISGWDVSKVTNMKNMFNGASSFNGAIFGWNVSNVTTMEGMFANTKSFNQNISDWNVSNVTAMSYMFYNASNFNQDLSGWKSKISETIPHTDFSAGNCPLPTKYHPYASWN